MRGVPEGVLGGFFFFSTEKTQVTSTVGKSGRRYGRPAP